MKVILIVCMMVILFLTGSIRGDYAETYDNLITGRVIGILQVQHITEQEY
jgi:hypothetical protein